jgi:hypothetical protein
MPKLTDPEVLALAAECDHWRCIAEFHAAAGRWDVAKQYYELADSVAAELSDDV